MATKASLIKSDGYPDGLIIDIGKIQAILRSIVEMVRSDNDVTDLRVAKATIETLSEIAVEGLESIRDNSNNGLYDGPDGDKKEVSHG